MTSVGSESVTGTLALTSVAWGTRLDLVCTYAPDRRGATYGATYSMVVHTRDGRVEQVATWKALAGKTMRLPGATSASPRRHHLSRGADRRRGPGADARGVTLR